MKNVNNIVYQSPCFNANAPLVLFAQRLIQDNERQAKYVLRDLVSKGYSLCVVADRTEIITKIHPITKRKIKIDVSNEYIKKMKKTLMKWGYPVKFAKFDEFKGYKYDIDTDDWDRVDYNGPQEDILVTIDGKQVTKQVPMFVRNDYIVNYYTDLKLKHNKNS
jgi:hypothetical protein